MSRHRNVRQMDYNQALADDDAYDDEDYYEEEYDPDGISNLALIL